MENTRYKVLFIEDNQLDQMAFKRFVSENDIPYDCIIASSVSEALQALDRFSKELPKTPTDPHSILALLDDVGSPATVRSTKGRYFGFVNGSSEPVSTAAMVLSTI